MKVPSLLFSSLLALLSANSFATTSIDAPIVPAESAQLRAASYNGKWSGTIKCLYDPGMWPDDECDIGLNFEISGSALLVRQVVKSKNGKESTSDINPGKFQFIRLATNAIAISLNSGLDEDGTWVETWSFAMTLTDPDHMLVHWTRIVNNVDLPRHEKGSKFSSVGMGELLRIPVVSASTNEDARKRAPQ
jgi:hypothetical protein